MTQGGAVSISHKYILYNRYYWISIPVTQLPVSSKLLFPAQNGSYINLRNFTQRYTKRIVENLVNEGKVKQYLPTYNLRNTSITHYLRQGVDIATVAALMETSEDMINQHYWSPDDDIINNNVQLPEI